MKNNSYTAIQNNFAQTVSANISRSTFKRPSSLKTTFNCGKLVPVYIDEVLPGDSRKIDMSMVSRLSTPLFPTMDDLNLEFYAFFVPNRLVWDGWEELCGDNKTDFWVPEEEPALVPEFTCGNPDGNGVVYTVPSKSIADYLGVPVGMYLQETDANLVVHKDCALSALPFRAYAMIWNEWFRDENLQAPIPINKGNDTTEDLGEGVHEYDLAYNPTAPLLSVNKYHDYFTSCLPSPQKGTSPLIPVELNKLIPVITGADNSSIVSGIAKGDYNNSIHMKIAGSNISDIPSELPSTHSAGLRFTSDAVGGGFTGSLKSYREEASDVTTTNGALIPINLYADATSIGNLTDSNIAQLRTLFQIQKLYEKDARGGTRYVEMLKAHFGVEAGDYRLQRPEFLGHYKTRVGMQSVPQTSSTDAVSPQGNLAAYSLTTGSSVICNKFFVEHGYIMIFAVARQVKTYQQGLDRLWSRRERLDFYYPVLSHISEQPVLAKQIYALSAADYDKNSVFGYQEAWAEYRFRNNLCTGQMRSGVTNSLDVWHYADYYNAPVSLSGEWMVDNSATNVDRTLAVKMSHDDQIRMDVSFIDFSTRPMPVYSIPGLVDHF